MVHKREEGTYHHIETLMKEMPGFLSPWERLASQFLSIQELIRNRKFLTDIRLPESRVPIPTSQTEFILK